jgi:hypothetical protein
MPGTTGGAGGPCVEVVADDMAALSSLKTRET